MADELDDDEIEEEWFSVAEARKSPTYNINDAPTVECLREKALGITLLSILVAPLDRAKIILQTQNELLQRGVIPKLFSTGISCLKYSIRNTGIKSLWRGTSVLVAANVLYHILTDIVYEIVQFRMETIEEYSKFMVWYKESNNYLAKGYFTEKIYC